MGTTTIPPRNPDDNLAEIAAQLDHLERSRQMGDGGRSSYVANMKRLLMLEDVTAAEKLVLLKIAERANGDGRGAYPGLGTLAQAACCTRRQAMRLVQSLADRGWLLKRRRGPKGNIYDLQLSAIFRAETVTPMSPIPAAAAVERVTPTSPIHGQSGDIRDTDRCHGRHAIGDMGDTEKVTPMSPDLPSDRPIDLPNDRPPYDHTPRTAVDSLTRDQSQRADARRSPALQKNADEEHGIASWLDRTLKRLAAKGKQIDDGDLCAALRCACDERGWGSSDAVLSAAIVAARKGRSDDRG